MKISQLFESERSTKPFEVKSRFPLYTGTAMSSGYYTWKFRTKPRDTFRPIHNTISKQSMDKFGINVRALLFGSYEKDVAEDYAENIDGGRIKKILPVGERFRLFASTRSTDMTVSLKIGSASIFAEIMYVLKRMSLKGIYWGFNGYVKECFEEYKNFEGDFDAFIDDMIEKIRQYSHSIDALKKERDVVFDEEEFVKEFKIRMNIVRRRFSQYIETVVELSPVSDSMYDSRLEVMIYAPDGFIIE